MAKNVVPAICQERAMLQKLEQSMEKTIFKSRWLLAPFYLGLVLSVILLLIKFVQELWHMATHVLSASESDVIVGILALVDMSLVGSLLLMIIFSGYEIFISKIDTGGNKDRPDWMGKVDFSGLKLKVIGAIVAISAIDLLKSFMDIPSEISDADANSLQWKVIIHMTFVVSGVLFAVMDKVAGDTKKH
ncbi:MAG TPA: TIGR00645 family protein [Spongiibacteraceae bacterium]|nr:TIGR00645 family protein [Spongiibacteraceae bacterium]